MNLILFEPDETTRPLPRSDRRAVHILEVLRRHVGETFDAGVINGPRGAATLEAIDSEKMILRFAWKTEAAPVEPITLIVGFTRPQTARDILREATTLAVAAIHFVHTEKSDANYARSTLWVSGEWRRHVLNGAEQAFATRIPLVTHTQSLGETLSQLDPRCRRLALDPYESTGRWSEVAVGPERSYALAFGGERGWSAMDRSILRSHHFTLHDLGSRVLRTESAILAALSILRGKLGLM